MYSKNLSCCTSLQYQRKVINEIHCLSSTIDTNHLVNQPLLRARETLQTRTLHPWILRLLPDNIVRSIISLIAIIPSINQEILDLAPWKSDTQIISQTGTHIDVVCTQFQLACCYHYTIDM